MKVAITGATGFIGNRLCEHFLEQGHEVVAVVRDHGKVTPRQNQHIHVADITSRDSLKGAFTDCKFVFHLAALFNHPDRTLEDYQRANVRGVENVARQAATDGVTGIVHCSTVGVAAGGEMPYSEAHPYCPPAWDKYETTKTEGEKLALRLATEEGLPIAVLRPAQVYGPGDTGKVKLYKMVQKGIIIHPGRTLKHLVYIDDLCAAFAALAEKTQLYGRPVIIAGPGPTPLADLINVIARELGVPAPKWRFPATPMTAFAASVEAMFNVIGRKPPIFRRSMDFFTKSVAFDARVMRNELGFFPKVSVEEGVQQTAHWYRDRGLI
jgi:nucleoside-diphosphate-sugar epimerase